MFTLSSVLLGSEFYVHYFSWSSEFYWEVSFVNGEAMMMCLDAFMDE